MFRGDPISLPLVCIIIRFAWTTCVRVRRSGFKYKLHCDFELRVNHFPPFFYNSPSPQTSLMPVSSLENEDKAGHGGICL